MLSDGVLLVLAEEARCAVGDNASKMNDTELLVPGAAHLPEARRGKVGRQQRGDEALVVARNARAIVKQRQDATLYQIYDVAVVRPRDRLPADTLGEVLFLLHLENKFVEQRLQVLVRVVDTQLLQRVDVERLKAVDVQDADGRALVQAVLQPWQIEGRLAARAERGVAQRRVKTRDDPAEEAAIYNKKKAREEAIGKTPTENKTLHPTERFF